MMKTYAFWRTAVSVLPFSLLGFITNGAFAQSAWETQEYKNGWQLDAVNAADAYALGYTGRGVNVGVLDSGLDTRHKEFDGRVLDGYDFTNDKKITGKANFDTDTHGTHVTGIIAADRDGVGMHGVAFDAKITPAIIDQNTRNQDAVYAGSWRFLADQGVSIINNSLGINDCAAVNTPPCNVTDYKPGELERNYADTIAAMKYTAEKDILMVFATGNEGQPSPDALGGMPYWIPELRDNWLVVGAVNSDGELADFSNRCGVAAEWCLVAPGVDVYSTMPLGTGWELDPDYALEDGTSMATPVVSGIAALVKEAFPFFSAKDLQQTLLTTATYMGDPELFGWGMVNAGKAVKGYGRFVSDVIIDTKGYDGTFANDIDGAGSLTKTGDGILALTGKNTYLGGTLVHDGTLSVNGTLSSLVVVGVDGTLRGTGTIDAPLSVAGLLAPGGSPGTLTVNGPVALQETSVSRFDIDGTGTGTGVGNYSRLVTTGDAGVIGLAGRLDPVLRGISGDATNTYVASLGTRFNIIHSSVGIIGSFDAFTQPGTDELAKGTRLDILYQTTDVSLAVTPQAYGDLASHGLSTMRNVDAVGKALDEIRPDPGSRTNALFTGLYGTDADRLANALGQLSGEAHASANTLHVTHANATQDAIAQRIRAAFAADGLDDRATFWSSANGGWGAADGGGAETFDWGMANMLYGLDAGIGDVGRFGLAAGLGHSNGDVGSQNASVKATHYDIVTYGSTAFGAFDASIGASYTWSDMTTRRMPAFGDFTETLTASYNTGTAQVFGEVGYRATVGEFDLNPFVSGAYLSVKGSSFKESGGSAALSGAVSSSDIGVTLIGTRISTDFEVDAATFSASALLGWQHLYGDVQGAADVRLSGGTPFKVVGAALARDAARLDLNVDYTLDPKTKVGLGYRGVFADTSHFSSIKGYLSVAF